MKLNSNWRSGGLFAPARAFFLALSLAAFSLAGVAYAEDNGLPEPSSPARASIEDGRIVTRIGTPRVDGYGIGVSIPVTIVWEMTPAKPEAEKPATPGADKAGTPAAKKLLAVPLVDVEGLKMQIQAADKLDVEMVSAATNVARYQRDGKEYLKVVFYVTTYVTTKQTQVEVKADFTYAIYGLEDGSPDWRKATTPVLNVGIRKTATDNQVTILEGNIAPMESPLAAAAIWFLVGGSLLILPLVGAFGLVSYRRYMQPKKLTANEETWLLLSEVLTEAELSGLTIEHYKRIFYALRKRYGVLALDGDELFAALRKHPDLAAIEFGKVEHVFSMESVFYAKANDIAPEHQLEFIEGIKLLVPRH